MRRPVLKMDTKLKLAAGRLKSTKLAPYLSIAIHSLIPIEAPGLGTFGVTEKGHLLYDPGVVDRWTVDEISIVLIHEVSHVLRDHANRCRRANAAGNAKIWNIAGDLEINDDIDQMGVTLPDDPPLPEKFGFERGLFAEVYYRELLKKFPPPPPQPGGQGEGEGEGDEDGEGGGGGQGGDQGGDQGDEDGDEDGDGGGGAGDEDGDEDGDGGGGSGDGDEEKEQDGDGDGDEEKEQDGKGKGGSGDGDGKGKFPKCGWGKCGSAAGHEIEGEPKGEDGSDIPGRTESEMAQLRRMVAEAIKQESQKGRGTIPGGWVRWADLVVGKPVIPWEQKLARLCRRSVDIRAGITDISFDRPHRWQAVYGFGSGVPIMPRTVNPLPVVAFVVDTSGSMGTDEIKRAVAEGDGVLKALDCEVQFVACDCRVHEIKKVRSAKELCDSMTGGGGTSFKPAFEAIAEMRPRPEIIVFVTDGGGDAPLEPPRDAHVIWVLVGDHKQKPSFGQWGSDNEGWGEFIWVDDVESADDAA